MAGAANGRVARLRALMEERGYDAVVLRNNADLRWLTGAERTFDDEVAHTAVVTADKLLLHTDSRYYNTFVERLGANGPWALDMEPVSHPAWTARALAGARARTVAVEDTVAVGFVDALACELDHASWACLMPRLHGAISRLRMVKDDEELALLRRAQEITDAAWEHIRSYVRPGMSELEIRAELERSMFEHGAEAVSFASIVAAGPQGANPHAQPGEYRVREGDFVTMDFGALYHDYHADMTRTLVVGEPTEKQREVYDVVRRAHEKAAAAVKAGVIGADIHRIAQKVIADAGYGDYFGHGLGHGVGVEIHEDPNFSLRWEEPVPEGSVVTIEPGIYLPGEFGVRIEDTGVVTADGYVPFTRLGHELERAGEDLSE
ncbi:M24 family metallopeptidase [Atopobiaceae bacterium 24-176]